MMCLRKYKNHRTWFLFIACPVKSRYCDKLLVVIIFDNQWWSSWNYCLSLLMPFCHHIRTSLYQVIPLHCVASGQSWYFEKQFLNVPLAVGLILELLCRTSGNRNFREKTKPNVATKRAPHSVFNPSFIRVKIYSQASDISSFPERKPSVPFRIPPCGPFSCGWPKAHWWHLHLKIYPCSRTSRTWKGISVMHVK